MALRHLACVVLTAGCACRAQMELQAHPMPWTNWQLAPGGVFFDLEALSAPIVVEGLTTANSAFARQPFHFELLVREGTALGGSATSGPGSSLVGWASLGMVEGFQGGQSEGVSQIVQVPRFVVQPGHIKGVALWFHYDEGPAFYRNFPDPYLVYQDGALRLTTGDARFNPFVVGQNYYPKCALVGSIVYEPVLCYPNCDSSTIAPVLNVNDFICFMGKFANGDTYANCDQSTTPPVLNVNDLVCFVTSFAQGCS